MSSVPHGTLGVNREQWGPGVDAADRERFDAVLEKVLAELEPIALQEQRFCINFFQMDVISPTAKTANLDVMEKSVDMSQSLLLSPSSTTGAGDGIYFLQYHQYNLHFFIVLFFLYSQHNFHKRKLIDKLMKKLEN